MDLVFMDGKDLFTTSRLMAKTFGRDHFSIIKTIDSLVKDLKNIDDSHDDIKIKKTTYVNEQNNQEYAMYVVNREAFVLIANRLHGPSALKFQLAYMRAFKEMEKQQHRKDMIESIAPNVRLFTATEIAKGLNMSAHQLNIKLRDKGILEYKQSDRMWVLKPFYENNGYAEKIHGSNDYGQGYDYLKWTGKGARFIKQAITERVDELTDSHDQKFDSSGMLIDSTVDRSHDLF